MIVLMAMRPAAPLLAREQAEPVASVAD